MVTVVCAKCGKEVRRWPAFAKAINYCSKSCANSANYNSPHKPPYQRKRESRPTIERQCEHCGTAFYVFPYRKHSARFCSRACAYASRQVDDSYTNFRARALNAFPHKCMICGFDLHVHAHHITPRSAGGGNGIDNAIVLCPNHHVMADRGLIPREQLSSLSRAAIAQLSDRLPLFHPLPPLQDETAPQVP